LLEQRWKSGFLRLADPLERVTVLVCTAELWLVVGKEAQRVTFSIMVRELGCRNRYCSDG
jgi:hypothetical protein